MSSAQRPGAIADALDYKALFAASPGPFLIVDPAFVIVEATDAYCRATMTERAAIVGRNIFAVFPDNPDDPATKGAAALRASFERVLAYRVADAMDIQKYDIRTPGGAFEERYWSPLNLPVKGADGDVRWILHYVEDITDLMRTRASESSLTEKAREQTEALERLGEANRQLAKQMQKIERLRRNFYFFALLVESSNDAIISNTPDGTIQTWNKAAERIFGYTAAEMVGRSVAALVPPAFAAEREEIAARLMSGETIQDFETRRRRKDGADIAVSVTYSPIRDEHGEVVAASNIVRDIAERKRTEEQLHGLQAELEHMARWNTMGMMTSTIAHELNQPLTAVVNFVRAAHRMIDALKIPETGRALGLLDNAVEQAKLAGGIMRGLRDFVDKQESRRAPEDMNGIVAEAVAFSHVRIGHRVELAPGLPPVFADRIQIQQVLLNLIRNAVESMQASADPRLTISTGASEGRVRVHVRDTGMGIAPEVMRRLFQPFVTTKSNGMGIGLTISQSIVEAHGGKIGVSPNEDAGACFWIELPAHGGEHNAG